MAELTPYEKRVRKEIDEWRDQKNGALMKAIGTVSKPLGWVVDKTIPDSLRRTVEKAVMGFMEMLRDGAKWTYSDKGIVKEARKQGMEVGALYQRLRARGTRGDVALGHCVRKLLHLVFAIWTTDKPFDRNP